jgi:hypothetical protein
MKKGKGMDCIDLTEARDQWQTVVNTIMLLLYEIWHFHAIKIHIVIFWITRPYSLVGTNVSNEHTASIFTSVLKMEAAGPSKTLMTFETTLFHN